METEATAASLWMAGPRDSQPNELDHEISFACSIASVMRSGSLRTKRKGRLRKGSFCILSKRGKIDGETGLRGSAQEAGVAGKTETGGRPKHTHQQPDGCPMQAIISTATGAEQGSLSIIHNLIY